MSRRTIPKRIVLGVLVTPAIALVLASVAYACTITVSGSTTVTPTSGKAGASVTATGRGGPRANTLFDLKFLNFKSDADSMGTCMSKSTTDPDVKIGGATKSDSRGNLAATLGKIPATAKTTTGTVAWICFATSGDTYATGPASFTVL